MKPQFATCASMAVLVLAVVTGRTEQAGVLGEDSVFSGHLKAAVEGHPAVEAARMREDAAALRADGTEYSFRTPVASAAAGYARGPDDSPGISLQRVAPADALSFSAGVEAPVGGGIYAGAGAAERMLTPHDDAGGDEDMRQTALSARMRVPLMRDRNYGLHRHEMSRQNAIWMRESAGREGRQNMVARDALLARTAYLQAIADASAVERAVGRAEQLYGQTSERAELQDVAAYQVFPTRYEVAMRKEEFAAAREVVETRDATLRERLGLHSSSEALVSTNAADIVAMAKAVVGAGEFGFDERDVLDRHPSCLSYVAELELAYANLRLGIEDARDSLDLSAGAGWRGETEDGFFGDREIVSSRNEVVEVGVAWRRPLDKSGLRSNVAAARAEVQAAIADLRAIDNQVLAELARARTEFASSRGRLELALAAVEEARRALESEQERFKLGEGTSRNVLDAQKDLTTASRRSIAVAGTVVDALVSLHYAAGRNPAELAVRPDEAGESSEAVEGEEGKDD